MEPNAANWILGLRYADIPDAVRVQLKRCVLDALGAAIAGTQTPAARIAAQFAHDTAKGGRASVLASGDRLAVPLAVLANVVSGNALDIDDGYRPSKGHPGGFTVMPAIAASQDRGSEGFLRAVVAGYEVATRAAVATHRSYAHYHASGSWGTLGSAACVGLILGLDANSMRWALGLAEYHAALSPIERCLGTPAMTRPTSRVTKKVPSRFTRSTSRQSSSAISKNGLRGQIPAA